MEFPSGEELKMSKGKVKEYDLNRGCGIIIDFDTGQNLTVYANYLDLKDGETLKVGQEVEYKKENNRHRQWLIDVRIV